MTLFPSCNRGPLTYCTHAYPLDHSPAARRGRSAAPARGPGAPAPHASRCTPGEGGLSLPDGLCAVVVGRELGPVRHLAVAANGDVFANVAKRGIVALRDTTGDGVADVIRRFGEGGTGVALADGWLYYATNDAVYRYRWSPGQLEPRGNPETIVRGLPTGGHEAKSIAVGPGDALYVNLGSDTNSCQQKDRATARPGAIRAPSSRPGPVCGAFPPRARAAARRRPTVRHRAPERARRSRSIPRAAISGPPRTAATSWRRTGASTSGRAPRTPARSSSASSAATTSAGPTATTTWTSRPRCSPPSTAATASRSAAARKREGTRRGVPRPLGADGRRLRRSGALGDAYAEGAFIAFHGSWNRAPLPQAGYRVIWQPLAGGNRRSRSPPLPPAPAANLASAVGTGRSAPTARSTSRPTRMARSGA